MDILILGGFLGSGKTTTLIQLAKHIIETSTSYAENKVMIIENEIGKVGVDDVSIAHNGIQVSTLFSGCACCSLGGELTTSLKEIEEKFAPDCVIIETTGVAYPSRIREILLQTLGTDSRICVLADAKRWSRLRIPLATLIEGQILGADIVLINKCDLVDDDTLTNVEKEILEIDPSTKIFKISAQTEPVPVSVWNTVLGK